MSFDDFQWRAGPLIPAIAYQPQAGASAELWFSALIGAYAKARHAGRLLASYVWPYDQSGYRTAGVYDDNFHTMVWFRPYVEASWTHLVALVTYQVYEDAHVFHQLFLDDGGTTAAAFSNQIATPKGATKSAARTSWDAQARGDSFVATLEVDLAASLLSLDQGILMRLDACATSGESAGSPDGDARFYRPDSAIVMAECRP